MSEDDKEYLRRLYVGMAMNGLISCSGGKFDMDAVAISAIKQADALMELLEPDEGIVSIRKRKYVKRQETK